MMEQSEKESMKNILNENHSFLYRVFSTVEVLRRNFQCAAAASSSSDDAYPDLSFALAAATCILDFKKYRIFSKCTSLCELAFSPLTTAMLPRDAKFEITLVLSPKAREACLIVTQRQGTPPQRGALASAISVRSAMSTGSGLVGRGGGLGRVVGASGAAVRSASA